MNTSIDTNILAALWNVDEAQNLAVKKALLASQAAGRLAICGAVYAELLASPARNEEFLDDFCAKASIGVEWELGERVWGEAHPGGLSDWRTRAGERIPIADAGRADVPDVVSEAEGGDDLKEWDCHRGTEVTEETKEES